MIEKKSWKNDMLKIHKALMKSTFINIDSSDEYHRSKLKDNFDFYESNIESAKTKTEINILMIEFLTTLSFLLLGELPDNYNMTLTNNVKHWKLDEYRKIIYTQNDLQKTKLIMSLTDDSMYCNKLPSQKELYKKLNDEFKGDFNKFISWFKSSFSQIYLDVF